MKVIQDIDFDNTTIIASDGKLKAVSPANNPLHGLGLPVKEIQIAAPVRRELEMISPAGTPANNRTWKVRFAKPFSAKPVAIMTENTDSYHGGSMQVHGVTNAYFLIRSNYVGPETMVIPYIAFVL